MLPNHMFLDRGGSPFRLWNYMQIGLMCNQRSVAVLILSALDAISQETQPWLTLIYVGWIDICDSKLALDIILEPTPSAQLH